jgi:ribosome-associated protein
MTQTNQSADLLISHIIHGIEELKGQETILMDLRKIENTVCDYFIICEGTSNTQVSAIVNSIRKQVSKAIQDKPINIEGTGNSEWVLMDYGNIVVHVFQKKIREYYDIEGLWGDAVTTELTLNN